MHNDALTAELQNPDDFHNIDYRLCNPYQHHLVDGFYFLFHT